MIQARREVCDNIIIDDFCVYCIFYQNGVRLFIVEGTKIIMFSLV